MDFSHANEKSIKRQQRSERKLTGNVMSNGVKDRNCIKQTIKDVGFWPSGQVMQQVRYLHVTKGWRERILPPLRYRQA
jgi:hypothetical protein